MIMKMAPKPIPFITLTPFLLLLSLLSDHAVFARPHYNNTPSPTKFPFGCVEHLQGCHKGDKLKDVTQNSNSILKEMMMPRCGVPDIFNGTTRILSGDHKDHHHSFHTASQYSFFRGNPKWPAGKYRLTYSFADGVLTNAINVVVRAFGTWQANTHFRFTRKDVGHSTTDLQIAFRTGDHGDGGVFAGRVGTLAHAFAPQNGRLHFDGEESWVVGVVKGSFNLYTVAAHEIGHLLGLGHSSVKDSIMWPTTASGCTKDLHRDDTDGIKGV